MEKKQKTKEEKIRKKIIEKEKKQKRTLERLGFSQLMFDFFTAPVV